MANKRKYEKYINEVDTGTFFSHPSQKEKQHVVQHYDYQDNFEAPHFISCPLYGMEGVGAGHGCMVEFSSSSINAGSFRAWPHKHPFPETFSFMGTDPEHPEDLGGAIEYWLGEGEEAEQYIITKPTTILVPKNMVHLPLWIRELRRPILSVVVMDSPIHADVSVKEGLLPPGLEHAEIEGWVPKPMVNKREYEQLISEIDVKDLPVFPSYKNRADRIMHYDNSIHGEAPHYIDCTLVFKEGMSFGVGNSKLPAMPSEKEQLTPHEAFLPHRHAVYETYSFIGIDRDHLDDLGGTIEFWMGEGDEAEKYIITRPTNILIPRNTVHLPMYVREVHRPFVLATVLDNPLWAGYRVRNPHH